MKRLTYWIGIGTLVLLVLIWNFIRRPFSHFDFPKQWGNSSRVREFVWKPPDTNDIPSGENGRLIRYGRDLVVHTATYLGPHGKIMQASNGMNCQNCHIDAGTRLWGNNFSMVATSYPRFRSRSNRLESIAYRVNECMERSLNGKALDTVGREMKALIAYLKWLGKDVPPDQPVFGAGTEKLPFLRRAADTFKGRLVFVNKCKVCHGQNGEGLLGGDSVEYLYPPLWGAHSYNIGAGLYRISSFAAYVKNNMPLGTSYHAPQLTNEEAWDVAAYVNSKPHPHMDLRKDWPKVASKPVDYPFGPFADTFSVARHKYGPFERMKKNSSSPK